MRLPLRPPLIVLAVGLLGLILLLASLQYVWLGRISEAERERLRATLDTRTAEFAQDFDRELTRAYLLFQTDPPQRDRDGAASFSDRYARWHATSAYPRVLKDFYVATRNGAGEFRLLRFDPAARTLSPAPWPASMADWRTRLHEETERREGRSSLVIRRIAAPIWETVPALIVPGPMLFVDLQGEHPSFEPPELSYTLLTIDLDYVKNDLLPALAQQHFRKAGDPSDYQVAVVDRAGSGGVIFRSTPDFNPRDGAHADAQAPLFQVRVQDFSAVAAEVRRFATFSTAMRLEHEMLSRGPRVRVRAPNQMSIVVQQSAPLAAGSASERAGPGGLGVLEKGATPSPRWQVIVTHPAGSLEAFVGSTRRRNLIVSTSILVVLAASMALLIVSTRRSQELARQQLEFVAAVSHELRTPLAVIRSAAENLADGVVHDETQVRKYGELVRGEGRRLSEMVEQILEFAGIQSGQRGFARHAVQIAPVIDEVLAASRELIEQARIRVDVDIPGDLPPVSGDESALRRVFQNLIGNAIKYGASGNWIGIQARQSGSHVTISVTDKGIGIAPAEQSRIFEPFYRASDVIAARIQGAGLGLSLVKHIVDAHDGRVTVKSAPGSGSEFTVSLPVAAGGAAESVPSPQHGAEAARSS